jgi:uncharacterized protein YihD (DUF1040 family)
VAEDSEDSNKVDYSRFDYPSDRLTIRDIRDHESHRIDINLPNLSTDDPHSIEHLLFLERCISEYAFSVALGRGRTYRELAREGGYKGYEGELVDEYMFYGLARTTHEAQELIRGIKDQARAQARESQGLDPDDGRTGRE